MKGDQSKIQSATVFSEDNFVLSLVKKEDCDVIDIMKRVSLDNNKEQFFKIGEMKVEKIKDKIDE